MSFTVMALAQDTEIVNIKVCCRAKTPMEDWRVDIFFVAAQVLNADLEARSDPRRVEVEVIQVNLDWSEYVNKFVHDYDAGEAPDIWLTGHEYIDTQVEAGRIIALDEMIRELPIFNLAFDTLWDCTKYKGKIWGVPQDDEERLLLYWSKSLLKQIGWTNEEIAALPGKIEKGEFTLYDMLETAKQAVDKGVVEPGSGFWTRPNNGPDFTAFYYAFGGETIDPATGKLVFDKTAGLKYYKFFSDAVQKCEFMHLDPGYRFGNDWGKAWHTEVSGSKVLFWVGGTSQWAELAEIYLKDLGGEMYAWENFGFGLIPAAEKGDKPNSLTHPLAHPLVYVINSQCKHQDLALALLRILQSQTEYKFYKGSCLLSEALFYMLDYTTFLPNSPYWGTYSTITYEALAEVVSGTFTPEEAVDFVVEGLNRELGDKTPEPKVLHESYATFPLTNQRILCWKYFDETSEEITFDCYGNLEEAENKEMQRYDELFGKLSPELAYCLDYPDQCLEEFPQEYAEEFRNRGMIPVAIWLEASLPSRIEEVCISAKMHINEEMSIEDVEREIQECFELQSNWYGQLRTEVVHLLNFHGYWNNETSYASIAAPLLYTELPIRDTSIYDELERLDLVDAIYLAGVGETKLDSAIPTIKANEVWDRQDTTGSGRGLYIEGKGIKIAVVESGRIDFTKDCFSFSYGEHVTRDNLLSTDKHKTRVAEVVANYSTMDGAAPSSSLLSADSKDHSEKRLVAAIDWALSKGAHILNASLGLPAKCDKGTDNAFSRYFDFVVFRHMRAVTAVAGNESDLLKKSYNYVCSPALGYNVVAVGGINDNNTAAWADDSMYNESNVRNPKSTFNDREKPDVCAVAASITSPSFGKAWSGTSFAAPAVAGVIGLLTQREPYLIKWPEATKAIVMVSAVHSIDPKDKNRIDQWEGAGTVVASEADNVVRNNWYKTILASKKDFPLKIHFNANKGEKVRFVITWDSHAQKKAKLISNKLEADLDLMVFDPAGKMVDHALHCDNSYEIAEFTAPATGVYEARIVELGFDAKYEFIAAAWHRSAAPHLQFSGGLISITVKPGKKVSIELRGMPGHDWALCQDAEVGTSHYLGLRLDLSGCSQVHQRATFDANGRAKYEFILPDYPAGQKLYLQAISGTGGLRKDLHKSNVLSLTVE
jgi:inositol-phosphate transport system substrate-binding protein